MSGKTTGRQISALQTKFPENNTCLVCEEQAPGYVCMDFKTFVCQTCADVHREFGHKISSILHSDWDGEEYTLIEKVGGNKRAVKNWLAFYNPEDFPRPARTDEEKVKAFIRKAFVIKCWQRQPTRGRTPSGAIIANVCEDEGAEEAPADNDNWACFPPVEEGLTFNAAASPLTQQPVAPGESLKSAGGAAKESAARPHAANAFASLPTVNACFCADHDCSAKRPKQEASLQVCQGCSVTLNTNYSTLAFCPGCSNQRSACLICGASCAPRQEEVPTPAPRCLSCGGSESTEAPPTSVKVDFSSDGEGVLDASSGAAAAGTSPPEPLVVAPATRLQPAGSLLDLDLDAPATTSDVAVSAARLPAPPVATAVTMCPPLPAPLAPPAPPACEDLLGEEMSMESDEFQADFGCAAAAAAASAMPMAQIPAPAPVAEPEPSGMRASAAAATAFEASLKPAAVPTKDMSQQASVVRPSTTAADEDILGDKVAPDSGDPQDPSAEDASPSQGASLSAPPAEVAVATSAGASGASSPSQALDDPFKDCGTPEASKEFAAAAPGEATVASAERSEASPVSGPAAALASSLPRSPVPEYDDPFKDCDKPSASEELAAQLASGEASAPTVAPPASEAADAGANTKNASAAEALSARLASSTEPDSAAAAAALAALAPVELLTSAAPMASPAPSRTPASTVWCSPLTLTPATVAAMSPASPPLMASSPPSVSAVWQTVPPPMPVPSAAAAAPAASSNAAAGLKLCEEVLSGNADALVGLFKPATSSPPPEEEEELPPGADRWAAFDRLSTPGVVPASASTPGRGGLAYAVPADMHPGVDAQAMPAQGSPGLAASGWHPHACSPGSVMAASPGTAIPPMAPLPGAMVTAHPASCATSSFIPDEWINSGFPNSKANAFDDVLDAFNKKRPSWEAKSAQRPPLAPASGARGRGAGAAAGHSAAQGVGGQQPRMQQDFGDLLSAFNQHKW